MIKYFSLVIILVFIVTGCAAYKFESSAKLYGAGYVVKRNERVIPEYTMGPDEQAPQDLKLAKERFDRRKSVVKYYYGKMGYIDSLFKMYSLDYFKFMGNVIFGVFKLPFMAYSYYKYEKDPKYRQKIDKLEVEADQKEEARIRSWQDKLNQYIKKDLGKEESSLELNSQRK
jgi:hypothetical protein